MSSEEVVLGANENEEEAAGGWKEEEESSTVRWESFLPRMCLRVLLVEADDSTRQIIAALLRRCDYKVAALPDGLKAWEMLKEKPHDFDIILSEVQLPSISGFCLLTMIMEHEICKNVPVIMMSSQDCISVVFKCMMRGAADFLVKPIRKNELRNLWQHVWRRQNSIGLGQGCDKKNGIRGKLDTTSENNTVSSHSSDYMACVQQNNEFSEKGSDSQSSCTKPGMEDESACLNNVQDLSHPKCNSSHAVNMTVGKCEEHEKLSCILMRDNEAQDKSVRMESEVAPCNQELNSNLIMLEENHAHSRTMTGDDVMGMGRYMKYLDMFNESDGSLDKHVRVEPSRAAIDLIGTIENQLYCSYRHTDNSTCRGRISNEAKTLPDEDNMHKFNSTPLLELCLGNSESNEKLGERRTWNHSNASAFSCYINRIVQPIVPSSMNFTDPQQCHSNTLQPANEDPGNVLDNSQCSGVEENNIEQDNPLVEPSGQNKMVFSCPQLGIIPVPIPFSSVPLDGLCHDDKPLVQPMFYKHPAAPPGAPPWSTDSTTSPQDAMHAYSSHQSNPRIHNSDNDHHSHNKKNADKSGYQSGKMQEKNFESREDPKHVSSATIGQTGSSSLCNGNRSNLKSSGFGSACDGSNRNVSVDAATSESGSNRGVFSSDGSKMIDHQRVSQREAALTKFRMKRKDRCYEKRVRYQSRKKLAEQRPRVKGQFVRRMESGSYQPSLETDHFPDSLAAYRCPSH